MDLLATVRLAAENGASDIHILAGSPPVFRIHGTLRTLPETPALSPEDIEKGFKQVTTPEQRAGFERDLELDFGYNVADVGRLRCNAAKQRGSTTMVIRLIKRTLPSFDQLGLPEVCKELILRPRGLVIVTGPTGSGKSTTLSAMINHLNDRESRRVVTVEDPIEYVYTNNKCVITQRELGYEISCSDG